MIYEFEYFIFILPFICTFWVWWPLESLLDFVVQPIANLKSRQINLLHEESRNSIRTATMCFYWSLLEINDSFKTIRWRFTSYIVISTIDLDSDTWTRRIFLFFNLHICTYFYRIMILIITGIIGNAAALFMELMYMVSANIVRASFEMFNFANFIAENNSEKKHHFCIECGNCTRCMCLCILHT